MIIIFFFLFTYSFAHIHNYRTQVAIHNIHKIYHHSPFFLATVPLIVYRRHCIASEMADKLIGNSPSRLYVHRPRSAVPGQKLQSPYARIPGWATPPQRIPPDHHSLHCPRTILLNSSLVNGKPSSVSSAPLHLPLAWPRFRARERRPPRMQQELVARQSSG
jgi:hypothetical protein